MWINSSLPPSNSFSYSDDNSWSIPGYPSLSFLDTSGDVLSLHQRDGNTWTKASPHWTPWSTNGRSKEVMSFLHPVSCYFLHHLLLLLFFFFSPMKSLEGGKHFWSLGLCAKGMATKGWLTSKTMLLRDKTMLEGALSNLD